jgi:hypothetical protein
MAAWRPSSRRFQPTPHPGGVFGALLKFAGFVTLL